MTRALAVALAGLLAYLGGISGGDSFHFASMTTSPGDAIYTPSWNDGVVSWFGGIWFNNKTDVELHIKRITFVNQGPGLELVGIYLSNGDALPRTLRGLVTGWCGGLFPPRPYQRHRVEGFRLKPHKNMFPMIGIRGPVDSTERIEHLVLVYERGGETLSEVFPFRAEIRPDRRRCDVREHVK